uniref:RING-type domain-containing protein n=1 Tax=Caenorhabditis japonica TaxID=281687 RepID=A0A8R1HJS1_CAEJA
MSNENEYLGLIPSIRNRADPVEDERKELESEITRLKNWLKDAEREKSRLRELNRSNEERFSRALTAETLRNQETQVTLQRVYRTTAGYWQSVQDLQEQLKIARTRTPVVIMETVKVGGPECQICVRPYSDCGIRQPKVLICGHTICEECAARLVHDTKIKCPFDRLDTHLNGHGLDVLPKNFAILEVCKPCPMAEKATDTDDLESESDDSHMTLHSILTFSVFFAFFFICYDFLFTIATLF